MTAFDPSVYPSTDCVPSMWFTEYEYLGTVTIGGAAGAAGLGCQSLCGTFLQNKRIWKEFMDGRNKESKEFLEFPNSLDGLGLSKRNDYQRNSKEFLQVPPKP
jgi:hypothetical protein